jgi:hypothetical protein
VILEAAGARAECHQAKGTIALRKEDSGGWSTVATDVALNLEAASRDFEVAIKDVAAWPLHEARNRDVCVPLLQAATLEVTDVEANAEHEAASCGCAPLTTAIEIRVLDHVQVMPPAVEVLLWHRAAKVLGFRHQLACDKRF